MNTPATPKLHLTVVSQEKKLVDESVDSVTAQTTEGEITILPRHSALITSLQTGVLRYTIGNSPAQSIVVSGGFLSISPDNAVTVLVDSAALLRDITESKAQEAIAKAQEKVQTTTNPRELILAEASLRKAMLELKIAQRTKKSAV